MEVNDDAMPFQVEYDSKKWKSFPVLAKVLFGQNCNKYIEVHVLLDLEKTLFFPK